MLIHIVYISFIPQQITPNNPTTTTTTTQGAGTPAKNTGIAETMLKLKNRQISVPT